MQFDHQTVELPKIKQKNNALPDGGRAYETPEGKLYPSITTVLSVRNKKGLHEWRERVGHDVANYIARTAANRGTAVHKMCEDYLNNQHLAWPDEFEKHKSKNFLAWCLFLTDRTVVIEGYSFPSGVSYARPPSGSALFFCLIFGSSTV